MRILRQNAIETVSDNQELAAIVDGEWVDDQTLTVGTRLQQLSDLCVKVLRDHGYDVKGDL
jgi:hypothetical protein